MTESPPLDDLLLSFESFGDNCELGVIQRQGGVEPLGLLRFSFTPLASLLRALECEFDDVSAPDNIEVTVAQNKELIITVRGYEFVYHSQRQEGEIASEDLKRQEIIKLRFLSRKTADALREGGKIFVRKGEGMKSLDDAMKLHAAMGKYGAPSLLWVTEADAANPPGSVRVAAPGLFWGRVDRFAAYDDAHNTSFTVWVRMLRSAHALWREKAPVGTMLAAPSEADLGDNLLRTIPADALQDALPRIILQTHNVKNTSILGPFPRRSAGRASLCRTVLTADGIAMTGVRVSGLTPGQSYTFSLWLHVEGDRTLEQARVFFPDLPPLRNRRIRWGLRKSWQRLEVTSAAPADGIMFPRINIAGKAGEAVYTANWRLEPGLLVESDEHPDLPVPPPDGN